jgi:hypothetical protein
VIISRLTTAFVAVLVEQRSLTASLAGDDDLVRCAQGLAAEPRIHFAFVGNAELDIVLKERIKYRVRDLVADLVRMSFRDRLAREQIVCTLHRETLPS